MIQMGDFRDQPFLVLMIYVGVVILFIWFWERAEASLVKQTKIAHKATLLGGICTYLGLTYGGVEDEKVLRRFMEMGLLPDADDYLAEDLIEGELGGLPMVAVDAVLRTQNPNESHRDEVQIFRGVLAEFSLPVRFSGSAVIGLPDDVTRENLKGWEAKLGQGGYCADVPEGLVVYTDRPQTLTAQFDLKKLSAVLGWYPTSSLANTRSVPAGGLWSRICALFMPVVPGKRRKIEVQLSREASVCLLLHIEQEFMRVMVPVHGNPFEADSFLADYRNPELARFVLDEFRFLSLIANTVKQQVRSV